MNAVNRVLILALSLPLLSACATSLPNAVKSHLPIESMTNEDVVLANTIFQNALETSLSGTTLVWLNPNNGHSGSVTPIRTYKTKGGFFCRVYNEIVTIQDDTQAFRNIACRDRDGLWKPI